MWIEIGALQSTLKCELIIIIPLKQVHVRNGIEKQMQNFPKQKEENVI
jgi:hypothetical protein